MSSDPLALSAQDVADYFLESVDEESGDNISNLKLQKLVYYAQGFHLALYGSPLFQEPIEAWAHGPVVRSLYRKYKDFGAGAIPKPDSFDPSKFSPIVQDLLDEVAKVYGQFSPLRLREMTHAERPWQETPENGTIAHVSMRDYFRTLLVNG
jgi:uncharacterized phage-associated protein